MTENNFQKISDLEKIALSVRARVFEMIVGAGKGHIGGSLSCVDILVCLYHGRILRVDPGNPRHENRDRFLFSKGHSAEALYAVLSERGFFSPDILSTYGVPGSPLGGHVDNKISGIEVSSGSLGHGLGIGAGLALGAQLDQKDYLTFVLMGDGECYEGSVWESAMFAAQFGLGRLVALVDRNRQITLDFTEDCNRLEPFAEKWKAFGWEVAEINGHSYEEMLSLFQTLHERRSDRPLVVIANTVKGKGISYMEGNLHWHHNVPKGEQIEIARRELNSERYRVR